MSRSTLPPIIAAAAAVICLAAFPVAAEGGPDFPLELRLAGGGALAAEAPGPDHFGFEDQYTTFGIGAFSTQSDTLEYSYFGNGYISPTTTSLLEWIAELGPANGVPVGATVIQVCAYVYDDSATESVEITLGAYEFGSANDDPAFTGFGSDNTGAAATPGYTAICVSPTNLVVRSYTDFAGDASQFYGYHRIGIGFSGSGIDTSFGGVLVRWQRQLSPAPGTATFGDVPTGYWAFAHVEALVDSGITAGCGGGDYCPDSPVTRAEMAVFLAKALGLFWPY